MSENELVCIRFISILDKFFFEILHFRTFEPLPLETKKNNADFADAYFVYRKIELVTFEHGASRVQLNPRKRNRQKL